MSETDAMKIEEIADRWQRRYTGPWQTTTRGPVTLRYRRQSRIEFLRFAVVSQRLWHELRNAMLPLVRWLARLLGS